MTNNRRWAIVSVCFLILMLIFATCISCMGVYVKPVTEEFGISRTTFTMTTTIQSLAMMLSAMMAGKLLEKYNMKLLMVIGTAVCGLGMLVFAIAPSIGYFYGAGVFMGVAISFTCNVPVSILIKNWFDKKSEGLALGIAFVGSGAGAMVLNPLYSYIIETYGWRYSFAFAGICILVLLIPLILIFVTAKPGESKGDKSEKIENTAADSAAFTLADVLRRPQTWFVLAGYVILTLVSMAILNHGVPFMTDYGTHPQKAAMIISAASGILIVGKIVAGRLYDKFGIYKMVIVETVLVLGCFTAFWANGFVKSGLLMAAFVLLYGIGVPVATISMQLVIPVMYERANFGPIMGLFSMAGGVGGMLQVVVSMVYDSCGSYYPAWITMSVLCALTIIIFAACVRPQKK